MKKTSFTVCIAILFCIACNQKQVPTEQETVTEASPAEQKLLGFWVGDFEAKQTKEGSEFVQVNKLNIAIKSIVEDDVYAQSIVAGNSRPLKGKITRNNDTLHFELVEPGDNKYDGKFEFDLVDERFVGTWESFDKNLPVTKRTFSLQHREFTYNAKAMLPENSYLDEYSGEDRKVTDTIDGIPETYSERYYRAAGESVFKLNSSTHQFTEEELKNLKKLDLEILRNTIFARHGYTFKKKSYRQFFDYVDWYVPVSDHIDGQLTALEKENIKLLVRFEKYATDNYDTFGR